jgi:Uma2 family endonuclease
MSTQPVNRFSVEEYLTFERNSEIKHEYYAGEIFAMSGASREHNLIVWKLSSLLDAEIGKGDCEAYFGDMRVRVDRTGLYTYPDAVVTCDKPRFEDACVDTLLNPQVIFEVLSDSTERYDRGKKFNHYRQLDSLRDYVLIAQDEPLVEHYRRLPDKTWNLTVVKGLDATASIETIDARLPLSELYAKVNFGSEPST